MLKYILLSLLVLFASANYQGGNATTPTGQLLQGINDQLGIGDDADVDACGDVPLIEDIEKTVDDLDRPIPNPIDLIEDFSNLHSDYKQMEVKCPEVATLYDNYFSNFTTAFENGKLDTIKHVLENMKNNITGAGEDIAHFAEDIAASNYYGAGGDFGSLIQVLLVGYVPE